MTADRVEDDFAGPGGWDVAATLLGLSPVGYEWDAAACATARAAGHVRVQTDVTTRKPPLDLVNGTRRFRLYIASPPCQGFSMAGLGKGRSSEATDAILQGIYELGEGVGYANAARHVIDVCDDERVPLVLWPLAWALKMRPECIAWEQVPAVLPLWETCARVLRAHGYNVATGNLQAEQYDTPQTRKRAILVASRTHAVALPAPLRRKYRRGVAQADAIKGQEHLAPWLSMADALGWASGELVGFPRRADTPSNQAGDNVVTINGIDYRGRDLFDTDRPAPVLTEKARSWQRWQYVNGTQEKAGRRDVDDPAPTVMFGHRANRVEWQARNAGPEAQRDPRSVGEPSYTIRANGSGSHPSGTEWRMHAAGVTSAPGQPRDAAEPSATITGNGTAAWSPTLAHPDRDTPADAAWSADRPSPTIVGSFAPDVVAAPGYRGPGDGPRQNAKGSVRVTVQEAAILQGFPADYPWQGTRTAQYRQIGDAVPPPLAWHVLRAALALPALPYPLVADSPRHGEETA